MVLENQAGAARDIVILNSGAAIYCAGIVDDLAAGMQLAEQTISKGLARLKLQELVDITNSFK